MVAPTMTEGLKLTFTGETVSRPYILMTLKMMEDAGVESEFLTELSLSALSHTVRLISLLKVTGALQLHGMK